MRHSLSVNVLQKTIFNSNALPVMSHQQFDIFNFDMKLHKTHKNTSAIFHNQKTKHTSKAPPYLCKIKKWVLLYKWSDICLMSEDTISYLSASMSSSRKCHTYHSVEHNFLCSCASMLHLPYMQVPQRCLFQKNQLWASQGRWKKTD